MRGMAVPFRRVRGCGIGEGGQTRGAELRAEQQRQPQGRGQVQGHQGQRTGAAAKAGGQHRAPAARTVGKAAEPRRQPRFPEPAQGLQRTGQGGAADDEAAGKDQLAHMQGHHAAEGGGVDALEDQGHQQPGDEGTPHVGAAQMQARQQGRGGLARRSGGAAAAGDAGQGQRQARQRQGTEEQGHGGKAQQVGQEAAADHAHQAAQAHEAVVTTHEIAAIVLAGGRHQGEQGAEAQERPGQAPKAAQQQPERKGLGHAVQQGGRGGQHHGQGHAGALVDAGIEQAHQRVERQTHQPVDGQQHAHLPERGQAAFLPEQGQGDVEHGIAGQAKGRDHGHAAGQTPGRGVIRAGGGRGAHGPVLWYGLSPGAGPVRPRPAGPAVPGPGAGRSRQR